MLLGLIIAELFALYCVYMWCGAVWCGVVERLWCDMIGGRAHQRVAAAAAEPDAHPHHHVLVLGYTW